VFCPLIKFLFIFFDSLKIFNLSDLALILIFLFSNESIVFLKLKLKGTLKLSPVKFTKFNNSISSKYKLALYTLTIEIVSSKLSLKRFCCY